MSLEERFFLVSNNFGAPVNFLNISASKIYFLQFLPLVVNTQSKSGSSQQQHAVNCNPKVVRNSERPVREPQQEVE